MPRRPRPYLIVLALVAAVLGAQMSSASAAPRPRKPALSSLSVRYGSTKGGTRLTIRGSGFVNVRKVMVGSKAGRNVHVVSSRSLTVTTPAHRAGAVTVRVVTKTATSAAVAAARFVFGRPTVIALSTRYGLIGGGSRVTITAGADTRVGDVSGVLFGTVAGRSLRQVSRTQLSVLAPAHAAGTVNIQLVTSYATSPATANDEFDFGPAPVVSKVSPAQGWTTGGALVTLTGAGFTTPSTITFGTTKVVALPGATPETITVKSPKHAFGAVQVRVATPWGTSAETPASAFTYRVPATRPWITPAEISSGGSRALSCATTTFCVDLDQYGTAHTFDGSGWQSPTATGVVPSTSEAIDCLSVTFCIAVGGGKYAVYTGSWGPAEATPAGLGATQVSCVSTTFCFGHGDRLATFDGTKWSTPVLAPVRSNNSAALSCIRSRTAKFCMIAGDDSVATYDGSRWTTSQFSFEGKKSGLSCATPTFCVAVVAGAVATGDGDTWTQVSNSGSADESVSCASATSCVALDGQATHVWNGSTWTTTPDGLATAAMSCATATFCLDVDGADGAWVNRAAGWLPEPDAAVTARDPHLVSCATTTDCTAIDADSNAITFNGTAWSLPVSPPADPDTTVDLNAIDCVPSTSFCMVGGISFHQTGYSELPVAYSFDGTWTRLADPTGLDMIESLSCATATSCTAADQYGRVATWDGSVWSAAVNVSDHGIVAMSCGDATHCLAIDGYQNVFIDQAGAWSQAAADFAPNATSVSCGSATTCLIGSQGGAYLYNGSTATAVTLPGADTAIRAVDCNSSTFCTAAASKAIYSWNGSAWSTESSPVIAVAEQARPPVVSISCASPALCALATDTDVS